MVWIRMTKRKRLTTNHRLYMFDGLYQSAICYFMPYLLFAPATFNTESGRSVNDYKRIGVYIANATVIVVNVYIMLNTYRWDWFMCTISAFSILLVFFWTGVYSAFTAAFTFYGSASQCYGSLSFWAITLLVIIICLLPRFTIKAFQKMFMPRDIDIVREQVSQGQFEYLKNIQPGDMNGVAPQGQEKMAESTSSSDMSKHPEEPRNRTSLIVPEDEERPIYPPSIGGTVTTRNPRSTNGSDGTDYTGHEMTFPAVAQVTDTSRPSNEFAYGQRQRPYPSGTTAFTNRQSYDRSRPSFDRSRPSAERVRQSMEYERSRPSFEGARDFTSAAYLQRVESTQSGISRIGMAQ